MAVRGDSMKHVDLLDVDLVVAEAHGATKNGAIVVTVVEGETSVKMENVGAVIGTFHRFRRRA